MKFENKKFWYDTLSADWINKDSEWHDEFDEQNRKLDVFGERERECVSNKSALLPLVQTQNKHLDIPKYNAKRERERYSILTIWIAKK